MKIHLIAASLILAAGMIVTAAEQFQVVFLPNQNEPAVPKLHRGDTVAETFAKRLSQCLRRSVKIVPFEQANAETVFVITSEATAGGEYAKILEGLPKDSFIIRYPVEFKGKKNVCLLMSRDPWGYCYPAGWFLRTQIGFDIVGVGEDGLVIPDQSKWKMPAKIDIKESPSFNTRRWTMSQRVEKAIQVMAMGESGRNISWHFLGRIIVPEKHAKTHPEYFPLVKGKRFVPRRALMDWTPCLGNPDVQRLCAEHLLRKPCNKDGGDAASLAVNDGGGNMCECELCKALDEPGGVTPDNYSNRFFRFYAKVLELARQKDPNVKATILLYHASTSKVPSHVKIHPGIIGMGTNPVNFDNFAAHGLKQMGLWDHQLDYRYPLIAHYPKRMAANLRHLYKIGMREYFGEIYMIQASNEPKQYVLGRLLWNIDTDVDAVMTEYCNKAFGPQAGPFVKAYYNLWEKIDDRMRTRTETKPAADPAKNGKEKGFVPSGSRQRPWAPVYHINAFRGLDQGDTDKLADLLKKAAASKMTDVERRRLKIVSNYFEYVRCMADRYLISDRLRNDKSLTIKQIRELSLRAEEIGKKFQQIWDELVSKDLNCLYRYLKQPRDGRKPRMDRIFYNFGDVISSYLYESVDVALQNLEERECKGMKRAEKVKFWEKQKKLCPDMTQISLRLNEVSGKPAPNMLRNGNFKKFKPGNPDVRGAHPQLEDWLFYEQIGSIQSDEFKSRWKIIPAKSASNHLGIGEGKYPEIRQYVYLPAGVYRFTARCRTTKTPIYFKIYQSPEFNPAALKDLALLRKQPLRTPELINFTCKPAPGELTVKQVIKIPADSWYMLMIYMHDQPKNAWCRLWGLKLEKLP